MVLPVASNLPGTQVQTSQPASHKPASPLVNPTLKALMQQQSQGSMAASATATPSTNPALQPFMQQQTTGQNITVSSAPPFGNPAVQPLLQQGSTDDTSSGSSSGSQSSTSSGVTGSISSLGSHASLALKPSFCSLAGGGHNISFDAYVFDPFHLMYKS